MAGVIYKSNLINSEEKILVRTDDGASNEHTHDFLELVYVRSGHAEQSVDGKSQTISAGDSFLIDMGVSHGYSKASPDFSVTNCLFVPSFLSSVTADDAAFGELAANAFASVTSDMLPSYLFVRSGSALGVGGVFEQMLDEYTHKRQAYLEALQSLLKVALITMFRSCGGNGQPQIIGDIIEMVKRSSDRRISLDELSAAMFFSPAYISRLFKKHTGKNLTDFIKQTRMQGVCRSLIDTDDSIDKIMSDHGYCDKKSFYEQFNKMFGCTPAQYRISNRKSSNNL